MIEINNFSEINMISIKNKFVDKINESVTNAIGASVVLQIGIQAHASKASEYPDATIHVGSGDPSCPNTRHIKFTPTHIQANQKLVNNRNIILELYLTEIIQHWFDFLAEIYAKAISENVHQSGRFPITKVKMQVDLSSSGSDLINSIENNANANFGFLPASEKLRIVKKILGTTLSEVQIDEACIKTNIQVRNILQHQLGIVSNSDLSDIGVSFIEEDHGNKKENISSGNKITRTYFDLENFVDSLTNVATALVKTQN